MSAKRKYTVPVLLLAVTVLSIGLVALYSKVLLDGQTAKTDKGKRLASSYQACLAFANSLNDDVAALAATKTAEQRLPVKTKLGRLQPMAGECLAALAQSGLNAGQTKEDATAAAAEPLQAIADKLEPIGDHEGPLTAGELGTVQAVQAAGAELEQTLQQYSVPTGDDRFRQMAAGAEWVEPAQQAVGQLRELAAALGE